MDSIGTCSRRRTTCISWRLRSFETIAKILCNQQRAQSASCKMNVYCKVHHQFLACIYYCILHNLSNVRTRGIMASNGLPKIPRFRLGIQRWQATQAGDQRIISDRRFQTPPVLMAGSEIRDQRTSWGKGSLSTIIYKGSIYSSHNFLHESLYDPTI